MITMRRTTGFLMLSAATLACSGKYEVGGMDAASGSGAGGTRAVGGSMAVGGPAAGGAALGSSAFAGGSSVGVAGTSSVAVAMPGGELGPQCVPSGAPAALAGPFAKPSVVWSRVATLIWGKPGPVPFTLPTATTYAFAADLVPKGFADATATLGSAPGAKLFVAKWLNLELVVGVDAPLLGIYDTLLPHEVPALDVLLRAPLAESGRVGVFTEPAWLALHPSISRRGEAMLVNVLQQQVPTPPAGIKNPSLDPDLSDRMALTKVITPPQCFSCHHLMDSVGYALGNFGANGDYRTVDHGEPVDTTGEISISAGPAALFATSPEPVMFDGIEDFGAKVADRCQPTLALADGFLRIALDLGGFPQEQWQPLFDANVDRIRQAFVAGGRSYPALVRAFAQSPAVLNP